MKNQKYTRNFIFSINRAALLAAFAFVFTLQTFAAPGDFDLNFGVEGRAIVPNLYGTTKAVQVQTDGKIVLVGTGGDDDWFVARLNADGSPDLAFGGGDGFTTVGQPGWAHRDIANAVYVRPADGKIFVAGTMNTEETLVFGIFNADGSLDTNAPGGGLVERPNLLGKNFVVNALCVTPNGKFTVVGETIDRNNTSNRKMFAARQMPDGRNDLNFAGLSSGGVAELAVPFPSVRAAACAAMPNGNVVIVGSTIETHRRAIVVKMNQDGSLEYFYDSYAEAIDFAANGYGSTGEAVAIQPDGKILVAGKWIQSSVNGSSNYSFAVARIDAATGFYDNAFGTNGKATVDFTNLIDEARSVLVQPDGKIVLAGVANFGSSSQLPQIAAARLNSNGTPDATFGAAGRIVATDPNYGGAAHAAALQTDGKIVVAGTVNGLPGARRVIGAGGSQGINANKTLGDFDGDKRADLAVFRPTNGTWYISRSTNNQMQAAQFGMNGDRPATGDFDGDNKSDVAVFRPSNGTWYILQSSNNQFRAAQFGTNGDAPAPADYDADGKTDIAVFRPANGTWYVLRSGNNQMQAAQFGQAGDVPQAADFDKDGKADYAVFRPSNGTWCVSGTAAGSKAAAFGMNGDVPQAADFDGDAAADYAVYRPANGTWYVLRSSNNQMQAAQFGASGDLAQARDYDGDGRADYGVFRPSNGTWYLQRTTSGFAAAPWGANGDVPSN